MIYNTRNDNIKVSRIKRNKIININYNIQKLRRMYDILKKIVLIIDTKFVEYVTFKMLLDSNVISYYW